MRTAAVLLAAGNGKRMGGPVRKQYLVLGGRPLMFWAMDTFEKSFVDELILVVSPGDEEMVRLEIVEKFGFHKVSAIVAGGRERYHSVRNGLLHVQDADYVLIHDLARPFVTEDILRRGLSAAMECGAAVVGVPVRDTIRVVDDRGISLDTPDRRTLWAAQTPQVFAAGLIREAYEELIRHETELISEGRGITDDGQVAELFAGAKVRMVEGSYGNSKVTVQEDLAAAELILAGRMRRENRYDG